MMVPAATTSWFSSGRWRSAAEYRRPRSAHWTRRSRRGVQSRYAHSSTTLYAKTIASTWRASPPDAASPPRPRARLTPRPSAARRFGISIGAASRTQSPNALKSSTGLNSSSRGSDRDRAPPPPSAESATPKSSLLSESKTCGSSHGVNPKWPAWHTTWPT